MSTRDLGIHGYKELYLAVVAVAEGLEHSDISVRSEWHIHGLLLSRNEVQLVEEFET